MWRRRGPPHGFTLQGALCAKHGAIALFPEPASYPRCSSFREMKLETFSPCYLISLPPVSGLLVSVSLVLTPALGILTFRLR